MHDFALPHAAPDVLRNLSPQHMFEQMALEHRPLCSLEGHEGDFAAWKDSTWPRVLATLGDFPARVPLNPVLLGEWHMDGLRKQRWLIDVGPHISATFLANFPGDLADGETRPAILCWHGHGAYGKAPVMDNAGSPEIMANIALHNYAYGHAMAKAGFITYAIDWIGGGERSDGNKPHFQKDKAGGRDWCNLYYLHATMLGMTSLSINLTHGVAATDFALTLPHVNGDNVGVMGLSGGGTMALWSSLYDTRVKATEIMCYSDLWPIFGMRDTNYCGMQVAPGLFKLVHLHDLQSLLAPRPLLVDIGAYDTCFVLDGAMACYRNVEAAYSQAGAKDDLWLDLFSADHGWGGNKSAQFFGQYLGLKK